MHANLDATLGYIFVFEGGFAARANEPGGSVNLGVSQQTLATWRAAHGKPVPTVDDVQALSKEEATEIYKSLYADKIGFDALPAGVDFATLDSAVNEGVGGALRFLADAILFAYEGKRPDVAAVSAASGLADPFQTIESICNARLAAKKQRAEWERFGRGWTARIESVRTHAKEMAAQAI